MRIYVNNKGRYTIEFINDDLFLDFMHWVIKHYKDLDNAHR